MKIKVGVLAGVCALASGIVWFLFAQSFMSTATTTRGEVTGRDCHGGDSHAPDDDDPDVETCVAIFRFTTTSNVSVSARDSSSSTSIPNIGAGIEVTYQRENPAGTAMRGQPRGLVLGPLLSFAGVIVLGIVWMMWRDQRNTLF